MTFEIKGKYSTAKVFARSRDEKAIEQIKVLTDQAFVSGAKIRVMPDYHWGAGCTIGFTADLGKTVIPNLVGVDIGCGMYVESLGTDPIDLRGLDRAVHEIPSGFKSWRNPISTADFMRKLLSYKALKTDVIEVQIGTLGGGNHFIEIDEDSDSGEKYLVIHSGSRNIGKQVADHYQKLAERTCTADVPRDLKYLTGEPAKAYLHDMALCQQYAALNRSVMGEVITDYLGRSGKSFQTIHNFIHPDDNIIRKGAVSARKGERLIIPMNMRDGSILAVGKGNPDWNWSAPHGAGRLMGRKEAKRVLDMADFKKSMQGVYSSSIARETLDEAPQAYKPTQEILDAIGDTVEVEAVIKPLYNFKAGKG